MSFWSVTDAQLTACKKITIDLGKGRCGAVYAAALVALMCFAGCSDMQFVNAPNLVPERDPREDIVLSNVSTDMTSGGLLQQRIRGDKAIYSEATQDLIINEVQVTAFGVDQTTRSVTQSDVGQIYFADVPDQSIGRRDMRFAGDVLYRAPQADDPTTDSMRLTSDLIVWDEGEQKFKSPRGYEMLLLPKGQAPVRQVGKGFEAAQDLTRFVVRTGMVTTELDANPEALRKQLQDQFAMWEHDMESNKPAEFVRPTPIPLPDRN